MNLDLLVNIEECYKKECLEEKSIDWIAQNEYNNGIILIQELIDDIASHI